MQLAQSVRHIVVAIPAHDEQEFIESALLSVFAAVAAAERQGAALDYTIGVAAHRCADDTYEVASRTLAAANGVRGVVMRDRTSRSVGGVRHRLIRSLLTSTMAPSTTWILSTDADSLVPRDWITAMLAAADRSSAVAVAGMTDLVDWSATPQARAVYDSIIADGLLEDGGHSHAYAANLAVRLDAYLAAGGFPQVPHGEDHALLAALRADGATIATPREPKVRTSGRMPGRAAHGLGDLLADLHCYPDFGTDCRCGRHLVPKSG